jgi:hypothetical protein
MLGPHILERGDMRYFNETLLQAQEPEHDLYGPPYAAMTGVNRTGHWRALQNLVSESEKRNKDLHDRLYSVLKYATVCDASDPRDKIYGLRMRNRASISFVVKLTL